MPNDESGKPLKSYTNQSESINNKLTRQKEAIAKNAKNKVHMSKVQFTKNVWEEVNRHQQEQLKLAISGVSSEYELAEVVAHLEVPVDEWFDMNEDERNAYDQEFNKMTIDDAMKGKTIAASHAPTAQVSEFKEFSVDVRKILQSVENWTDGLVATIVKDAETLLNLKDAVQRMPSISSNERSKYLVAAKNCKKGMYECALYSDHVNCSCPCYKFNNLCKHSICVAEIAGKLKEHLDYLKKSPDVELHQKAVWSSQQKKHRERKVAVTKTHGDQSEGPHRQPLRHPLTAPSCRFTTTTTLSCCAFLPMCQMRRNVGNAASSFLEGRR